MSNILVTLKLTVDLIFKKWFQILLVNDFIALESIFIYFLTLDLCLRAHVGTMTKMLPGNSSIPGASEAIN